MKLFAKLMAFLVLVLSLLYVFCISFVVSFRNVFSSNPLGVGDTISLIWVSLFDVENFVMFLIVLFLSSVLTAVFSKPSP